MIGVFLFFAIPFGLMIVFMFVCWAFGSKKCPNCKSKMEVIFNEETMDFEYECTKCGKRIKYDEERDNRCAV